MSPVPALMVLEDGRVFRGRSFGAAGQVSGELVVVTGISGYQEALTDPGQSGKILIAAGTHIGNTGWNDEDNTSERIQAVGYIVRDLAPRPSNWRARRSLDEEMAAQGTVGIADVDTRALVRHLRDHGPLRAAISTQTDQPDVLLAELTAGKDA